MDKSTGHGNGSGQLLSVNNEQSAEASEKTSAGTSAGISGGTSRWQEGASTEEMLKDIAALSAGVIIAA